MKKYLLPLLSLGIAFAAAAEAPLYSIPVLGDLHYDRMDCHDLGWVREKMSKDMRQIENYTRVTEAHAPELLRQVEARSAKCTEPVPFVIQLGDFTEGLCGSRELQAALFRHAFALTDTTLRRPFWMTRGNHDVTGPGAWEAGDDVWLPRLRRNLGDSNAGYNYAVEQDQDVFLFFEPMRPDLEWLKRNLDKYRGKRHIFLATHYPILPYNYRAHWGLLARKERAKERGELLELLAARGVVVLSAHLHQLSVIDRVTPAGRMVQMSVSSVINRRDAVPTGVLDGVAHYRPELALQREAANPNIEWRKGLIAENMPWAKDFYRADFDGYAVLQVYADRVEVQFFNLTAAEPVLTRRLK